MTATWLRLYKARGYREPERVSRDEQKELCNRIQMAANDLRVSGSVKVEVVGSYRRGTISSSDCDIIIYGATKEKSDQLDKDNFLPTFINYLQKKKIIICTLSGEGTFKAWKGYAKLSANGKDIRLDVSMCHFKDVLFFRLFKTGSALFCQYLSNYVRTTMGQNYSFSQYGLFDNKSGHNLLENARSEEDIFKLLGLVYLPPNQRIPPQEMYQAFAHIQEEPVFTRRTKCSLCGSEKYKLIIK
jgi:DNA polymerase/3'-5' exonuclease PolX